MHYGTARLLLTEAGQLAGEYYTGRGRMNRGGITLHRTQMPDAEKDK
jgi:hypothetical protein